MKLYEIKKDFFVEPDPEKQKLELEKTVILYLTEILDKRDPNVEKNMN